MWADMHACAHCLSTIDISHSLTDLPAYCICIGVHAIFVRTCMYMYMYMCVHVSVLLYCCVVVRTGVHVYMCTSSSACTRTYLYMCFLCMCTCCFVGGGYVHTYMYTCVGGVRICVHV